jgi:hypothetical protein
MKYRHLAVALSALIATNSIGGPLEDSINAKAANDLLGIEDQLIEGSYKLPPMPAGMILTRLKNGESVLVDANMRFAMKGQLFDVSRGQEIVDAKTADEAWLINSKKLDSIPTPTFSYGADKMRPDLTIMIHPDSEDEGTKEALEFVKKHSDKYRIDLMLMATRSRTDALSVGNLYCAADHKEAKSRILKGKFPIAEDSDTHLEQMPTCQIRDVLASIMIASMYQVKAYPFIYNQNGAFMEGLPKSDDLDKFVALKPTGMSKIEQNHSKD